jgi:hypothetical protein
VQVSFNSVTSVSSKVARLFEVPTRVPVLLLVSLSFFLQPSSSVLMLPGNLLARVSIVYWVTTVAMYDFCPPEALPCTIIVGFCTR